jgi:hypothetical protein
LSPGLLTSTITDPASRQKQGTEAATREKQGTEQKQQQALTDGEVGNEHVLERGEKLLVHRVRLEVDLALVRRADDGHLDELAPGELVPPVSAHWRPANHPSHAHASTNEWTNQSEPDP